MFDSLNKIMGAHLKERFALLKVIENQERFTTLCFASHEDAKRFKEFGVTYVDESGAGNGYGAYWVYSDLEIVPCFWIPNNAVTILNTGLVTDMVWSILRARFAVENPPDCVGYKVGLRNGALTFLIGEFPPKILPTTGDMYRIPRPEQRTEEEFHLSEGRVLADFGDEVDIVSSCDIRDDSITEPKEGAKKLRIKKDRLMKINDYLARIRARRKC